MTSSIPTPSTTSFDEIDRAIARLHERKASWEQTSIPQRLKYLARQLLKFKADPTWQNLPGVVVTTLRG